MSAADQAKARAGAIERMVGGAVAALMLATGAGAVVNSLMQHREAAVLSQNRIREDHATDQLLRLTSLQKQIEIDVVQVQQFLTDVSATRAQNGLGDGFDEAAKFADRFKADVAEARAIAVAQGQDGMVQALDGAAQGFPGYYDVGKTMAHAYVDGGPASGNPMMPRFDAASDSLAKQVEATRTALAQVRQKAEQDVQADQAHIAEVQRIAAVTIIAAALAAAAAGWVILNVVRGRLLRPLTSLAGYMGSLAEGRYDDPFPFAQRQDEFGRMSGAVSSLREAALERRRTRESMEAERERQAAEQARLDAVEQSAQAERDGAVSRLAQGLGALAQGRLTERLSGDFPPAYERLRQDFNTAAQALDQAMAAIAVSARTVGEGSRQISHGADDLAGRTERQAAALQETSVALGQLTAAADQAVTGAREARTAVSSARDRAQGAEGVVTGAIGAMGRIQDSSSQIGQIIGVIDEIAFQTNLLALNAGVEAARAGDAGRGFAVVAQEVRALAGRSADAARQIKTLISNSGVEVKDGVELVRQTGEALGGILTEVAAISGLIDNVAHAYDQQAGALSEVSKAVADMDRATQQNAAMVEETTAASHGLAGEAENLRTLIGQFRASSEDGASSRRRAA